MIQRIGVVLFGLGWAFLLFLCTGWLSFPGDAVAKRVVYEVQTQSRGAYQLELTELQPWWFGLKTDDLKVYGRASRDGTSPLLALATDARASASPFSLLARAPYVSGSVTLGLDGQLDYAVGTSMDETGEDLLMSHLELSSDSFPIAEFLALVPSYEGSGNGGLQIDTLIDAPDGVKTAEGKIELRGKSITLSEPVIMDFPLGRDVVIQDLDLELDVAEGKAKISRGRIVSDLANADVTGTITLAEPFDRSTMDVRVEAELDSSMAAMAQMLKSAEVNGKLVWRCVGRVNNLARACSAGDKPKPTGRARNRARNRGTNTAANRANRPNNSGLSTEEREKRRKELQERLKKRRERRKANRAKRAEERENQAGQPGDAPDDLELDPEPFDGEPDPGDDLGDEEPLDDEEFIDDDEFVDDQ